MGHRSSDQSAWKYWYKFWDKPFETQYLCNGLALKIKFCGRFESKGVSEILSALPFLVRFSNLPAPADVKNSSKMDHDIFATDVSTRIDSSVIFLLI